MDDIIGKSLLKRTKQREIIISIIKDSGYPITAAQIYKESLNRGCMNLSTVYRTLNILCSKGLIKKYSDLNGNMVYQLYEGKHGHYIICERCHSTVRIDLCPLEGITEEIGRSTGYVVTGHSLTFTGLCPKCAKDEDEE